MPCFSILQRLQQRTPSRAPAAPGYIQGGDVRERPFTGLSFDLVSLDDLLLLTDDLAHDLHMLGQT